MDIAVVSLTVLVLIHFGYQCYLILVQEIFEGLTEQHCREDPHGYVLNGISKVKKGEARDDVTTGSTTTGTINPTINNDTTTDPTTLGTTDKGAFARKRAKIAQRQQERGYCIEVAHDMSNDNNTAIFNVGGTKYQVSKSLLWKFPHCLLSIKLC